MNNFNLNSSTYNLTELENLLGLEVPYTIEQLEGKKIELRDKIVKMQGMESSKKKNILIFLDNIGKRLLDNLNKDNLIPDKLSEGNNPILEKVNPDVKHITKFINIDSLFRNDYYNTKSSDFTFMLPDKITKVIKMNISSLQIPLSNYAVSSSLRNNTFTISYQTDPPVTITIPDGNYSSQFKDNASSIEIVINNLIIQCGNPNISSNVKFNVDKISGKSIFTCSGENISIDFTMNSDNDPLSFKFGWLLGFRAGKYTGPSIISEGLCHINGSKYIFLGINDYQNSSMNNFIANFNESTLPSNIITRLNLDSSKEENGPYNTSLEADLNSDIYNNFREYFGPVDIQKLTFTLYDHYGRVIDLNYMDWSLVLSLTCQFD